MTDEAQHDPQTLSDRELAELLHALESEERTASRRRSVLHDRIDYVRSGGSEPATAEALADALLTTEREVGERRRQLHTQINELRSEQLKRRTA